MVSLCQTAVSNGQIGTLDVLFLEQESVKKVSLFVSSTKQDSRIFEVCTHVHLLDSFSQIPLLIQFNSKEIS